MASRPATPAVQNPVDPEAPPACPCHEGARVGARTNERREGTMTEYKDPLSIAIEIAKKVVQREEGRLHSALASMVVNFRVYTSTIPGPLSIIVEECGSQDMRLNADIHVTLVSGAWRQPFEPTTTRFEGDLERQAGRYVLEGLRVGTYVNIPAIQCEALDMIDHLDKAARLARIVRDFQRLLTDGINLHVVDAGRLFLGKETA